MSRRAGIVLFWAVLALFFGRVSVASVQTGCVSGGPCVSVDTNNPYIPMPSGKFFSRQAAAGSCGSVFENPADVPNTFPYPSSTRWDVWNADHTFKCGDIRVYYCDSSKMYDSVANRCVDGDATSSQCGDGYTPDPAGPGCKPPPVIDCSRQKGDVVQKKLTAGNSSNWCFPTGQLIDPSKDLTPDNFITGSCAVELSPNDGAAVRDVSTGDWLGTYRFTGQKCGDGATPNPSVPVPTTPTPPAPAPTEKQCIVGSGGTEACITPGRKNCGTFNGTPVCVNSPPPGNCTFASGGNWACDSAAPTPPKPASTPEFEMPGRNAKGQSGTLDIFPPNATGGGDANSTYTSGSSSDSGGCGDEAHPCKIDETGTPTVSDADFADAKGALDQALTDAQGEGGDGPQGDGSGTASGARAALNAALPTPGDCGPLVMTLPGGRSYDIDLYDRCSDFRAGLGWMLGLSTAWFVLDLIFKRPG